MIEFVTGDFFDYEADIRINTVNCVGVMGAGVALLFKERYPDMFTEYAKACDNNEIKPGKPHVWSDNNIFSKTTIINFPTKIHWKNPSEYEFIEKGLIWLKKYLLNKEFSIVTLPALGCGHGGLDWNVVKNMIVNYLGDVKAKILVFEPSSSMKTSLSEKEEEELVKNNIHKILPGDKDYPMKLLGRSAIEILWKGNYKLIQSRNLNLIVNSNPDDREKNALIKFLDELPKNKFSFLLGFSNSYEIDVVKEVLSKGFNAVIILPYGILKLNIRKDLQEFWNYNNIVVVSTTNPNQSWKNYESTNSLKFRLKLANLTLINSLDYEKLSNFEKDIKLPENFIFYVTYWNSQIDFFNKLAAKKVGINPETKRPNISPILETLENIKIPDHNMVND
ncbi:MAG: macro domain-containing protein [Salinivirgaceae bacterium]|jgi:O-acetyl-ADP-ribose deacetylase (regulator of RNase III)